MGQEHNENWFPIHTPSILHGALVAFIWVWPSCTKRRLRAIWAWLIVISIKYHKLWPRKRPCELIKVGASEGHSPQPHLPIFQLQDCSQSLLFTYGPHFTDFSFARLCTKSLPFTHVLHNFSFNYIWYHLNCKNPAAKDDHLPCH
jgi:hypothetical protein